MFYSESLETLVNLASRSTRTFLIHLTPFPGQDMLSCSSKNALMPRLLSVSLPAQPWTPALHWGAATYSWAHFILTVKPLNSLSLGAFPSLRSEWCRRSISSLYRCWKCTFSASCAARTRTGEAGFIHRMYRSRAGPENSGQRGRGCLDRVLVKNATARFQQQKLL